MASSLPPRVPRTAQSNAHLPRAIMLMVEPQKDGTLRISTPHARGWAATASNPLGLARAVQGAIVEVQVASYARQRGHVYDLDGLTAQVPGDPLAARPVSREPRARRSRRSHPPDAWQMVDGGSWRSPNGRVYGAGTKIVRNVVARREALGLPVT